MQNHRPARSKRKRVRMPWTAPYTSIPHINGPAARAGPSVIEDRSSSAVHAALLTSLMTALSRLLRRFLLAATLLLLTGLLPAAALLLTRARIALLRLARLRLVRIVHVLLLLLVAPESPDVNAWNRRKLRRKTADCACETRTDIGANFAKVPSRIESGFTPACKHDRGRRARDRWARRAPFRPRRKTRCGFRPI